jgi:hypothetical protein
MIVYEKTIKIPISRGNKDLLTYFSAEIDKQLEADELPIRFVVTQTDSKFYYCDLGLMKGISSELTAKFESVLSFRKRRTIDVEHFNAVLLVPTGIGAEIGGHAGDAGPVAKLLGNVCDTLITHPNVVNASDINEIPANGLYVEGSTLARLLMGTIGLRKVRSNRILFVIDTFPEESYVNDSINAMNAARATYGVNCPLIVKLDPPSDLKIQYTSSGRASGVVNNLEVVFNALDTYRNEYDAVAFSTIIQTPPGIHKKYFDSDGQMINPWGGIEAIFTHTISQLYNIPSAHSPMKESNEMDILHEQASHTIEPRLAAEWISNTYLQCIFKGLQNSPQIVTGDDVMVLNDVLTANDISCLVIPDGCIGLPVLAALEQGITVIAVKENKNLMKNDLTKLPWQSGQFYRVDNYLEAAGVMSAIKAGITPESVRRPILKSPVKTHHMLGVTNVN